MKLEKYVDKSIKKRKIILISISLIVLVCVSFLLYKTFASFTENVEFQMMKGKVDYFGNSDIYFVFYKQGELVEEMPLKDNADNIGFDHAECDNEASIIWNEEEWAPLVKNLKYVKTKCSLYFEKTKYYVSTNGNDEANGNKETPLRTIQEAYNRIVTRGTIILLSNVEESNGLTFNSEGKEVTITSEEGTYEIDRGTSLTSKPIIELTNKNNLTLTNLIFNGKEISSTKALIEVNNSSLTINKGTIIENGINTEDGGGIRTLNDGKLVLNGGEIKNNKANFGGGIRIYNKCYFEMNGGNIINNIGTTNGGGIHIDTSGKNGSIINIKEGLISKNISQNAGAGIAVSKNSGEIEINITGGTISENEAATNDGGGILINAYNQNGSIFNLIGGEVSNNIAGTYGGGLRYHQNSGETTLNLKGTNFIGNTAENQGGGIYIQNKNPLHFELSKGLISKNITNSSGGGIYIHAAGENNTYNITGGEITKNEASKVGGGIRYYLGASNNTLNISNVLISENTANSDGGGMYLGADKTEFVNNIINLQSGEIKGNKCTGNGAGIYLQKLLTFNMSGGNVTNNTSTSGTKTGGVYSGSDNVTYNKTGGTISDNVPSDVGGIATK